jgi:hypothetical protein
MRILAGPSVLWQKQEDAQSPGAGTTATEEKKEQKTESSEEKTEDTTKAKEGKTTIPPKDQPITPAVLKGVLDYQDRSTRETFQKLLKEQEKGFQGRLEKLEKLIATEEKKGKQKADETPPEIVELRRELDEFRQRETKLTEALDASKRRDSQYRFETQVKASLTRHGCKKPEEAYYVLAHRLTHDEENGRIFAVVDGEYGREEMELDNYIQREVKENIIPEFFHGMVLSGSAAGGDSLDGEGKWKFTKEQVFDDPKFYAAHREEIEQALQDGRVKGVPRPQN